MIRWRRVAAWLGVVAQLVGVHSLGAQSRPELINIAISGIQADLSPPERAVVVSDPRGSAK